HQRHPARRPPALEPEDRTAHRRHRQPAAGGPDPDPAIQRLRRAGGRAVRRHGPAQVVLSRGPAAPTGRGGRRSPAQPAPAPLVAAKAIVHLLALAPLSLLAWRAWLVARGIDIDALGPDPVAAIEHELGQWALRLLLLTLAVTPLRQLTGQPVLLRFRRMLGLYAFAYASLHFAAWLGLDLGGYWRQVFEEIARRPYVTAGFAAWLLLLPLALTSTRGWMRRLGRRWGRLHRLAYAIAVLAVLHFWWIVKSDYREPLLYAAILALLLGWRMARRLARPRTSARPEQQQRGQGRGDAERGQQQPGEP